MHGQSPASPEGGRYLSRVGGGVVALGQTGERHPWIWFFFSVPWAGAFETRRRFQTGLHSYSDEELAAQDQ